MDGNHFNDYAKKELQSGDYVITVAGLAVSLHPPPSGELLVSEVKVAAAPQFCGNKLCM